MSFTIKQLRKKGILNQDFYQYLLIASIFKNNSSVNLVKNLDENGFCHLNQEFNVNVLDSIKKKGFFFTTTWITLKNLRQVYPEKINFIMQ